MEINFECTTVFEKLWDAMCSGKYKYIRLRGGSGSSKTYSILQALYLYGCGVKDKRISAFRATQTTCRKTVGEDARRIYGRLPIRMFHKTTYSHWLRSGTTIEFTGTDDPDIMHGYETEIAWFNEPYDIPESVFTEVDKRATAFVIIDLNPKEDHWSDKLALRTDCLTIDCTFEDNPFLPERRRQTILSYKPVKYCKLVQSKKMTEVEAKEFVIGGDDNRTKGKKFTADEIAELLLCQENERQKSASEYQWRVYGLGQKADRPNRIFHWTPLTYDEFVKIDAKSYVGIDWGVSDPFAVVLVKYKDGKLYVHEINYKSENEWSRDLATVGKKPDSENGGIAHMVLSNCGLSKKIDIICDSAQKDRVLSLRTAGWDNAISIGHKERVVQSVSTLQQIDVFYTSVSSNIYLEQENYEREIDRYGVVLEDPVDKDNHTIDAIRYVVTYLKRQGIIKIV